MSRPVRTGLSWTACAALCAVAVVRAVEEAGAVWYRRLVTARPPR